LRIFVSGERNKKPKRCTVHVNGGLRWGVQEINLQIYTKI
jgi:hypothetical protein